MSLLCVKPAQASIHPEKKSLQWPVKPNRVPLIPLNTLLFLAFPSHTASATLIPWGSLPDRPGLGLSLGHVNGILHVNHHPHFTQGFFILPAGLDSVIITY